MDADKIAELRRKLEAMDEGDTVLTLCRETAIAVLDEVETLRSRAESAEVRVSELEAERRSILNDDPWCRTAHAIGRAMGMTPGADMHSSEPGEGKGLIAFAERLQAANASLREELTMADSQLEAIRLRLVQAAGGGDELATPVDALIAVLARMRDLEESARGLA